MGPTCEVNSNLQKKKKEKWSKYDEYLLEIYIYIYKYTKKPYELNA